MKQSYTVYKYKTDRRTKTGEKLVRTFVCDFENFETTVDYEKFASTAFPAEVGYRIEIVPTMKTVVNLMSGKEVQIPHDTPLCCDPSSETYWSM